ncbi:hypothetical protein VTN00DRAFT_960 [Thermoascus crustaceus]|uniref:uncharacterized protein n=1 Tax=Thermoascus crustaceus TaxID=5088 RepID=UPI0037428CAE
MGSKRKSEDSISRGTPDNTEKRVKTSTGLENAGAISSESSFQEQIRCHLTELEKLIGQMMNSPDSIRDHITEARHDIVKAAAKLEKAFAKTKDTSSSGGNDSNESKHSEQNFDISGTPGLPQLPPIKDKSLEKAVFTHPGVVGDCNTISSDLSYDRLEILGDAYVELIATRLVWDRFPNLPSGRMSQIRELLVKNETLAEYATSYGFDRRASVPRDHLNQPKRWNKTKGDIFEAYVAAIILSDRTNGYDVAERWLSQLWIPKLSGLDHVRPPNFQCKEALAKKIMGKGVKLKYIDERPPIQLKGGMQTFFVGVYLTGWGWDNQHLGSGQGLSKTSAGDQAASQALLNKPLIDEIAAVKRAYDAKTKTERATLNQS